MSLSKLLVSELLWRVDGVPMFHAKGESLCGRTVGALGKLVYRHTREHFLLLFWLVHTNILGIAPIWMMHQHLTPR